MLHCNLLIAFLPGTFGQWYRKGRSYQSSNSLGTEMKKKKKRITGKERAPETSVLLDYV